MKIFQVVPEGRETNVGEATAAWDGTRRSEKWEQRKLGACSLSRSAQQIEHPARDWNRREEGDGLDTASLLLDYRHLLH